MTPGIANRFKLTVAITPESGVSIVWVCVKSSAVLQRVIEIF